MPTTLQNPLIVPIRVDALWSDGNASLRNGLEDFSLLDTALNGQSPWLGDTLISELVGAALPTGMHLHWTLPAALTHGHTVYQLTDEICHELSLHGLPPPLVESLQSAAGKDRVYDHEGMQKVLSSLAPVTFTSLSQAQWATVMQTASWDPLFLQIYAPLIMKTAAQMKLPPVPNRWLVVRSGSDGVTNWIVESDRLTAADAAVAGAGPCKMQVTLSIGADGKPVKPTHGYQFLGLTVTDVGKWTEDATQPRLSPLTAAGSGLPEFAAFYPNCQGVFGLHDDTANEKASYTYTVIGWFSDAADDPIGSGQDLAKQCQALKWSCATAAYDGSLYVARVQVCGSHCPAVTDANDGDMLGKQGVSVAVGNSTGQALAAALAAHFTGGADLEKLLDAAQTGALRHLDEPDGMARMEQALHQQSFRPSHGGTTWSLVPQAGATAGLSAELPLQTASRAAAAAKPGDVVPPATTVLPASVADLLNTLNLAQRRYDQVTELLLAQRELIFADWCRSLQLNCSDTGTLPCVDGVQLMNKAAQITQDSAYLLSLATQSAGDAIQAAGNLYLALATLQQSIQGMPLQMSAHPAPRFWQPHDPVLLFYDASGQNHLAATPREGLQIDAEGCLVCPAAPPAATTLVSGLPTGWTVAFQGLISALASPTGTTPPTQNMTVSSWRPLFLEWDAALQPCRTAGALNMDATTGAVTRSGYPTSFLQDSFQPAADGIDLQLVSDAELDRDVAAHASYKGRVLLSPKAVGSMKDRILSLLGTQKPVAGQAVVFPGLLGQDQAASSWLNEVLQSGAQTLSQALDGFHDHLLMRQRIRQLSAYDPQWGSPTSPAAPASWDALTQSFYPTIGRCQVASPVKDDRFHPIRAGVCEISDITLVDRFGQTRRWQISEARPMAVSRTLPLYASPEQGASSPVTAFHLPPRLTQPSRLLFRWLAADGSGVEANAHPASTPVLGWVMLNRVDESIQFLAADGTLLGWVDSGQNWVSMPGAAALSGAMLAVQQEFSSKKGCFDAIATSLLTIEPHAHRQHSAASVLVSRPLALCAAALRLELKGMPAAHQGYGCIAQDKAVGGYATGMLATPVSGPSYFLERETCDFEKVQVPVRLGDVSMADDGLVAWWPADAKGQPTSKSWNLVDPGPDTQAGVEPTISLTPDPTTAATQVLLLLDPRACVHASSGILPVKSITLPPELYAEALKKMELIFSAAPVLTPAGTWTLPIPAELSSAWSWLPDLQSTTVPQPLSGKVDDRAHLPPDPAVLRRGWLRATIQEKKGVK